LRKLGGKAGHRALNIKEPTPPLGPPDMPPDLPELAKKEWKSIVPQLEQLGLLSRIDGKALAGYCHAYARWAQAEQRIEKFGIVIEEPVLWKNLAGKPFTVGYRHKKNPACNISEAALKTMKSFLIEFGMTPAARSRLRVEKPAGEEKDPFEKFLNRGAKTNESKRVN
jgi:P27 family predicted phage terminase small subunit